MSQETQDRRTRGQQERAALQAKLSLPRVRAKKPAPLSPEEPDRTANTLASNAAKKARKPRAKKVPA